MVAALVLFVNWTVNCQAPRGIRMDFRLSRIILANDDTLTGYVAVWFGPDLLCVAQPDSTVRAFEPAAVKAFAVQREVVTTALGAPVVLDSTVVRLFRSVVEPLARPESPPRAAFYEQLCAGPVSLLRRPYAITRVVSVTTLVSAPDVLSRANMSGGKGATPAPSALYPARFSTVCELREMYYLAWGSGKLRQVHSFKKDVLAAFPS